MPTVILLLLPPLVLLPPGPVHARPRAPSQRTPAPTRCEAQFSPGASPGTLRAAIAREVRRTRRSLDIALYTGMTADTAREVASASRAARVRVLVDEAALAPDARAEDGDVPRWRAILEEAGVHVRTIPTAHLPEDRRPAFHHKFAVVDRAAVLTGSYNWSARGDGLNYENLVVIRDRNAAAIFSEEFERLWGQAEPCPGPRPPASVKEAAEGRLLRRP